MKLGRTIHTPHDGDLIDPEITHEKVNGRYLVLMNGHWMAFLDLLNHRLWQFNPGLRDEILNRIRAETLVEGSV